MRKLRFETRSCVSLPHPLMALPNVKTWNVLDGVRHTNHANFEISSTCKSDEEGAQAFPGLREALGLSGSDCSHPPKVRTQQFSRHPSAPPTLSRTSLTTAHQPGPQCPQHPVYDSTGLVFSLLRLNNVLCCLSNLQAVSLPSVPAAPHFLPPSLPG